MEVWKYLALLVPNFPLLSLLKFGAQCLFGCSPWLEDAPVSVPSPFSPLPAGVLPPWKPLLPALVRNLEQVMAAGWCVQTLAFSKIIPGPIPLAHLERYLCSACILSFPILWSCMLPDPPRPAKGLGQVQWLWSGLWWAPARRADRTVVRVGRNVPAGLRANCITAC